MARDRFSRTFWIVTGLHVGFVVVLLGYSTIRYWLFQRKPKEMVTFVTLYSPAPPAPAATAAVTVEAPPDVPAPPVPPAPAVIAEPPPKPKIERSTKRVRRDPPPPPAPPPTRLTPEELKRQLAGGLPTGTSVAGPVDPMNAYYQAVFNAFYAAWIQPASVPAGTKTQARIRIQRNGQIVSRELLGRSGDAAMDTSVRQALDAVQRLRPLPAEIPGPHYDLTIEFELTR